ncbi:hypothetical protein RZS28_03185 [Methylocapsa polymorpha]|uniref:Uncharacterized protein n=1 Tax=Methylocapsa polymorpha TaxID=3080828 RepID=A0ABZ0HU52_9HYPH|nr:hypothetical protein RZS28_03185 [Methylocapsa sp. RX1]
MQSQVGSRFIEYIWPAQGTGAPEVLERFPFWSSAPSVGYFRSLAHAGVRSFYRTDHPHSEQILVEGSSRTVFPEAVRVVDQDGKEICRWTTEDEYEELQGEG